MNPQIISLGFLNSMRLEFKKDFIKRHSFQTPFAVFIILFSSFLCICRLTG